MFLVNAYPTHSYNDFQIRIGRPYPFGATLVPEGINFSVFSRHANYCVLVLFKKGDEKPLVEIPFRGLFNIIRSNEVTWAEFRIGNVFCITVFNLDYENIEYCYRMDSSYQKGIIGEPSLHRFDTKNFLLDPYSRGISGRNIWNSSNQPFRSQIVNDDFDWGSDVSPELAIEDLVIYEMHIRGFSVHPSSHVKYPGTYSGILEKIPYLKSLGVNCIELMPVFEFDERDNRFLDLEGKALLNYWGYNPIGFFAIKAAYAAVGHTQDATLMADEFKNLIKELHQNGIEVILDVVFNHTGEGNEFGPVISLKGIDNATYYMLTPENYYYNFSGTGNTLNCNNPIIRNLILDCLRFWVSEYHIDGFRFDLAAILGRDTEGNPMINPPLLEELTFDSILGKCKLIAEAWDAGGLYQVGSFPGYKRWLEWNSNFRDVVRQFLRGDWGQVPFLANVIQGSPHLYQNYGMKTSVNFVACHDGFTLLDIFSYSEKHNEQNGENNQDGCNDNFSSNFGCEGETSDQTIISLRKTQVKNAIAILMISQGIPMITMGDEFGRTQKGNNNAYCQDNDISWLNWNLLKENEDLFVFTKQCIKFRNTYPILKKGLDEQNSKQELEKISFHGPIPWEADWSDSSKAIAVMFQSFIRQDNLNKTNQYFIYVIMNMNTDQIKFILPKLPNELVWHLFANTRAEYPNNIYEPCNECRLEEQEYIIVNDHSVIILVGR